MIQVKQMLITSKNRPNKILTKLTGVVIHYTADYNAGANAVTIRNYFDKAERDCSAHYAVDDHEIIQIIPDREVAWHVGAKSYTAIGDKIREGHSPNYYTVGIEMCVNSDGDWNKTYVNAVSLTASLLMKNKLTVNDLYRHYDITGKICPAMMIEEAAWAKFKADVLVIMTPVVVPVKPVPKPVIIPRFLHEVLGLQKALNYLGFKGDNKKALIEDGQAGPNTTFALKAFQKSAGIRADGVVGPTSWAKLESAIKAKATK